VSEEDTEENLKKCAVSARDVIKKLLNVTYNVTDKKTLKHIEKNVRELIEEVQPRESIP
jgi:myosin-crossreactive antigen